MVVINIGSYNMAWATDQGRLTGTERSHIQSYLDSCVSCEIQDLWRNSLRLLFDFLFFHRPSIVGLQELNDRSYRGTTDRTEGYQAIRDDLSEDYESEVFSVLIPGGKPSIMLLWDRGLLGEKFFAWGCDLLEESESSGRPFQVVVTKKLYILVNLHAPKDCADLMQTRKAIQCAFSRALEKGESAWKRAWQGPFRVCKDKIFITGDFNDFSSSLNKKRPLRLTYKTKDYFFFPRNPPKSCCNSYQSACYASSYNSSNKALRRGRANGEFETASPFGCFLSALEKRGNFRMDRRDPAQLYRGFLATYQNTGDYCLGSFPLGGLRTYRSVAHETSSDSLEGSEGISRESDHELVWGSFWLKP